jgi:hypothetical protein
MVYLTGKKISQNLKKAGAEIKEINSIHDSVVVDLGKGESKHIASEFVIEGSKAYLTAVHQAHNVLILDVDYKELEEKLAASMLDALDCKVYDEIHRSAYRSGKSSTTFHEMVRFCEMYGCTVDNVGNIINGDDPFIQKMLDQYYPEMKEWYNKVFQKPCGEIPCGEGMKCLPPPENNDDDTGI